MTKIFPKVLDISHYDSISSFQKMYDFGVRGLIHKATQGTGYLDDKYVKRRRQALDAGFLWGAYHFGTKNDIEGQVNHFLEYAQPDDNTLVALDYEPYRTSQMTLEGARKFLQLIEKRLGRKAVLYSGSLIKEVQSTPDEYFGGHKLWLAQYGSKAVLPPSWKNKGYFLWQFSGDGINTRGYEVPGISDDLDLNHYDGTDEELAEEWAK